MSPLSILVIVLDFIIVFVLGLMIGHDVGTKESKHLKDEIEQLHRDIDRLTHDSFPPK